MQSFIIGIIAGTLCTISFIPQIVKIIKTRQAKDLSLLTFSIFALGVFLWFIYGIMIKEIPVILANGITLVLVAIVVAAKLKYG